MKLITLIGDENNQKMKIGIGDGTYFEMILIYKTQQIGWFASITYGAKTINNIRIVTSGNMLHQWKNIFPFGLAVTVEGDQEPTLLQDFKSGRAKIYVLTRDEVSNYSEVVSGQATA